MTVIIKSGLTLTTLVKKLWTPTDAHVELLTLAEKLENDGYTLRVSPSHITIVYIDDAKVEWGAAACDLKAADLFMAIKHGGYQCAHKVPPQIVTLLYSALDWHEQHGPKKLTMADITDVKLDTFKIEVLKLYFGSDGTHHKVAAIMRLRDLVQISLYDAKKLVEKWVDESPTLGEMLDADAKKFQSAGVSGDTTFLVSGESTPTVENPVYKTTKSNIMALIDAEHLHQAVHGTSAGSRYYVIALGDDVKVAARIKGATDISIKAICTKAPQSTIGQKTRKAFERASLEKAASGGHWSIHLKPTCMVMAERSIGSTLFAMGLKFWAVSGDLQALVGK